MLKGLLVAILVGASVNVYAGSNSAPGTLPGSNQITPVIAYAVTPAPVAVSSTSVTRIDTAVNTALAAALGNNYFRASVEVQIPDAASVKCGYSTAVTTQATGGYSLAVNAAPLTFNLGKAIGIYCQGVISTATFMVGGLGFK